MTTRSRSARLTPPGTLALDAWLKKHASTRREFAKSLGVSPQALHQWLNGERPMPWDRAIQIGALTRHAVPQDVWAPKAAGKAGA